nr:MAG: hypothetical protein [Microvirus sp.]
MLFDMFRYPYQVFVVNVGTHDGTLLIDDVYEDVKNISVSRVRELITARLRNFGICCDFFVVIYSPEF